MKNRIAAILNLVEPDQKLKPLTNRRPVASLPFACRYRLIDFPFSALSNAQVKSAALFIPDSGHSLYDHIRSGYSWGLDNEAGGGVFTHSHIRLKTDDHGDSEISPHYYEDHQTYIQKSKSKYVVVWGTQILTNINIRNVLHFHKDKESDITVAYKKVERNIFRDDTIYYAYEFSNGNHLSMEAVKSLQDYSGDQIVNAGLDFLLMESDRFLYYLDRLKERRLKVDVKNIVELALADDLNVNGYEYTSFMYPIEDLASYFQANMEILDEETFNSLFYRESPILTKSKNSAPTFYGKDSVVSNAIFANDCEIYGVVKNSLVFRKSSLYQDTEVYDSIIMQGSTVDEGAYLKHVILDKRVYVEKGARLEGTAENPVVVPKNSRVLSSGEIVAGE